MKRRILNFIAILLAVSLLIPTLTFASSTKEYPSIEGEEKFIDNDGTEYKERNSEDFWLSDEECLPEDAKHSLMNEEFNNLETDENGRYIGTEETQRVYEEYTKGLDKNQPAGPVSEFICRNSNTD